MLGPFACDRYCRRRRIMVLENFRATRSMACRAWKRRSRRREITFAAMPHRSRFWPFLSRFFYAGVIGKFFFQFGVRSQSPCIFPCRGATIAPMRVAQFLDVATRQNGQGGGRIHAFACEGVSPARFPVCQYRRKVLVVATLILSRRGLTYFKKGFVPSPGPEPVFLSGSFWPLRFLHGKD